MANKIIMPNGTIAVEAEYRRQILTEYIGNPFIEALTPLLSPEEVAEKIAVYPNYNVQERLLDKQYRVHLTQRLFQFLQPLTRHLDLESRISRVIYQGYLARNPFNSEYIKSLNDGVNIIQINNNEISSNSDFRTTGAGFSIIGPSGVGKSVSLNRVLSSIYPQVIVHKEYNGFNFSVYQVTWLKLECPYNGSLRGLALQFFSAVDSLLSSNFYKKFSSGKRTVDSLLISMIQVARSIGLGVLIIDEIQHLSNCKGVEKSTLLSYLVTLQNSIGIPIILVSTPKGLPLLQSEFRQARRGSGQGDFLWDRLKKDEEWDLLIQGLWNYQWTRKEIQLNSSLADAIYEECQGIIDLAVKLYVMSQIVAITNGTETVTPELIRQVADKHLQLVRPMIQALKSGNIQQIAKYEDICTVDIDFASFINKERASVDLQMKIEAIKRTQQKKEQEVKLSVKEQAILKLIELKIEAKIAQVAVEKVIGEKDGLDVNEVVIKAIQSISASDKREKKHRKAEVTVDNDLRIIVAEGRKENKTAYETLRQNGFIKSYESDFSKVG